MLPDKRVPGYVVRKWVHDAAVISLPPRKWSTATWLAGGVKPESDPQGRLRWPYSANAASACAGSCRRSLKRLARKGVMSSGVSSLCTSLSSSTPVMADVRIPV